MAAESEMSAFRKIRKAATEREWCPERPSAEAGQSCRNELIHEASAGGLARRGGEVVLGCLGCFQW